MQTVLNIMVVEDHDALRNVTIEPKNSSYPDAARVGGGVGKPI